MSRSPLIQAVFRLWSPLYDLHPAQHLLFRRVHEAAFALAERHGGAPARVLDLGCGTGLFLQDAASRWPGAALLGADLSRDMLRRAAARLEGRIPLLRADVHALPVPDGSLDLVVSTISYHWWADPVRALTEIRRSLAPGGRLLLATPAVRLAGGFRVPFIVRWPAIDEVRQALVEAGYRLEDERRMAPIISLYVARPA